jgi:hypothetical protein
MSPCTPFQEAYGKTLGEWMAGLVAAHHMPATLDESTSEPWGSSAEARFLLDELDGIHANLSPRSQKLAAALRNFVARRVPRDEEGQWDLSRQRDLVLRNSGTISLVYFNVATHLMDMSEIELIYPGLLRQLVEHPGLGLVLGREGDEAMVMTLRGPRRLYAPADPLVRGLLDNLPDPALAARQLARLMSFPSSGDLVLMGHWNDEGQTIAFEPHWATHGGLGGEQNRPFMLLPPGVDWDVSRVTNPEQLYPLFMAWQRQGAEGPEPADIAP